MKATVSAKGMREAVRILKAAVDLKNPVIGLTYIQATVDDSGLSLRGTDRTLDVTVTLPVTEGVAGAALLPFRRLTELKLSSGEITLSAGEITTADGCFPIEDADAVSRQGFPEPCEFPAELIPCPDLPEALAATAHALSKDTTKPWLGGFLIRNGRMVTTDGVRVAFHSCRIAVPEEPGKELILPGSMKRLARHLANPAIGWDDEFVYLADDALRVVMRRIPGVYPDIDRLLPRTLEHRITLSRSQWVQRLKMMPKSDNLRIKARPGQAAIRLVAHLKGEVVAEVDMPVQATEGAKQQWPSPTFNTRFLLDAIQNATTDSITFTYSGERLPARFDGGDLVSYVLPIISL